MSSIRRGNFPTHLPTFLKGRFKESRLHPINTTPTVTKFPTHVPAGHQDDFWGVPESIQGQLGSVCVFHDPIHEQHGFVLNFVGELCGVFSE